MTNVINFPKKIVHFEEVQFDLFDYAKRNIGKYNFLDVYDTNQAEVIEALNRFDFRVILDIRDFPTFERPKYNHREFIKELNFMKILYIPIVYMGKIDTPYKKMKPYKTKLHHAIRSGPVLFLYNKHDTEASELEGWSRIISKRYSRMSESHPATFGFR